MPLARGMINYPDEVWRQQLFSWRVGLGGQSMARKNAQIIEEEITENHISEGVSVAAELAIDALIGGASVTEAALAAGIRRETLSRWIHDNPIFQAALNRRRSEARQERMRGLITLITDIEASVRKALSNPETSPAVILQSGLNILPKLYALMDEQKIGSGDPEELAKNATRIELNFNDLVGAVDIDAARRLLKQSTEELRTA